MNVSHTYAFFFSSFIVMLGIRLNQDLPMLGEQPATDLLNQLLLVFTTEVHGFQILLKC